MKITWFGHSNFRLEFGGKVVLIDPFFTGNPSFKGDRDTAIKGATHILITHGHADHIGDTVPIAEEDRLDGDHQLRARQLAHGERRHEM